MRSRYHQRAYLALATTLSLILATPSLNAQGQQRSNLRPAAASENRPRAMDPLGTSAFAIDFHQQIRSEPGNLFYSPTSLSTAMGMVCAGARGETAAEIARVFHFKLDPEPLARAFAESPLVQSNQVGYQLDLANRLWGQDGHPFLEPYLTLTREHFGAKLTLLNFAESEASRKEINDWVAEKTRDKIRDLIPSGVLTPLTRLVLTNAIYFKGDWSTPFPKGSTRPEPFHLQNGKDTSVPMMHLTSSFGYRKADGYQVLQMEYKGNEVAMVIVLPDTVEGLAAIESKLTPEHFEAGPSQRVIVSLPRFKVETSLSLQSTLSAMGMPTAFSSRADLSAMDGTRELYLSAVLHKAFVDVNESGTEAAAATGMVVATRAMPAPDPKRFQADHPFLFAIKHLKTNELLFVGRLAKPGN